MRTASTVARVLLALALTSGAFSSAGCGARPSLAGDTATATAGTTPASDAAPDATTPEATPTAPDAADTTLAPRYPDARTVVFAWPPSQLQWFRTTIDGQRVTGTWAPTDDAIARFDRGLPEHLRAHASGWTAPALDTRQAKYFRQFGGVVAGGRRFVHGFFFCDEQPNWKTQPVGVDDGGDCYFEVLMDAETGVFTGLMINGHA